MSDEMSIPGWLTPVSWFFLALAALSAVVILVDIAFRGYRQRVGAMSAIWPMTALYLGPLAIWAYYRWGRPSSPKWQREHPETPQKTLAAAALTGGTPGGAASTIGHFIGVPLILLTGITIAGLDLWAMIAAVAIIATAVRSRTSSSSRRSPRGVSLALKGLALPLSSPLQPYWRSTSGWAVGCSSWPLGG